MSNHVKRLGGEGTRTPNVNGFCTEPLDRLQTTSWFALLPSTVSNEIVNYVCALLLKPLYMSLFLAHNKFVPELGQQSQIRPKYELHHCSIFMQINCGWSICKYGLAFSVKWTLQNMPYEASLKNGTIVGIFEKFKRSVQKDHIQLSATWEEWPNILLSVQNQH